ncbi:MAG: HAMP domain-containing histidine kinase [Hyphomicrobiales bacterium]|nr:HAMP domain-containing histidine kinase [Hyphomicrobiales bacterium]MDE2016621.1 HAMP domain-containing histidine kinase [Hyphomicrobiales bacterium]
MSVEFAHSDGSPSADAFPSARKRRGRLSDLRRVAAGADPKAAFPIELLELYAGSRKAAMPVMVALAVVVAATSSLWVPAREVVVWASLAFVVSAVLYGLSIVFLDDGAKSVGTVGWRVRFVVAEAIHGAVWAVMLVMLLKSGHANGSAFALFVLLMAAASTAMVASAIPTAVYSGMMPLTIAIVAFMRPGAQWQTLTLSFMATGALLNFAVLAARLHATALRGAGFRAEKDALITELEEAKLASDIARHRAEEANLAKSRFLATMSHELRTPLNAILGFSEVMKGELLGPLSVPAYRDYCVDIHSSGQHLLSLINEILDLSRVEAGRYELKEEPISLSEILDDARRLLDMRSGAKGIAISASIEAGLPRIWGDERAVRQIALNLLTNAVKFTPQGGGVEVKVGWTQLGGQYFSIRDDGPGIPENEIPVVMSSFGRGSLAQKNAQEGSGLGLPIVKGLIELHGGRFVLKSKVGEGTQVVVIFPPERVMDVLPRLDPQAPAAGAGMRGGRRAA